MPPFAPWTMMAHMLGEEMVENFGPEIDALNKVLQGEALEKKISLIIETISAFKYLGKRVLVYVRDAEAAKLTNAEMNEAGLESVDFCHMRSDERATAIGKRRRSLQKFLQEFEAMSGQKIPEIHESISGQHRLICAFEVVRELRKGMISCYPRMRMHWPNMCTSEAMAEGRFYAAVGRFLMANPAATHRFTRATMEGIASTWEECTEISMERVMGICPALPNPVTIYNHVMPGKGRGML
ncbi:hypothetical protein CEP51_000964 [Fusarium floridanum]|uniref:Uncharacterized protein n=1 Tax=Fusarium floridanum TaxID=1325733 RepID=A0A428SJF6_9HYPO|nr:hypothetical protein CEP51_000964 [Fusarium floridanum]